MVVTVAARAPLLASRVIPALVTVGAVTGVVAYVRGQLKRESSTMDKYFSSYRTPESEASRRNVFKDTPDPRKSLFNVLGW